MREHRGDGHVDRLVDAGLSPPEALVLQAATGRSPEVGLRSHRGWSEDEWLAAAASLRARSLIDGEMHVTAAGAELRQAIEDGTDRLATPIVAGISDDAADELIALLRPLAEAVMATGAVPAHNNIGRALAAPVAADPDPSRGGGESRRSPPGGDRDAGKELLGCDGPGTVVDTRTTKEVCAMNDVSYHWPASVVGARRR